MRATSLVVGASLALTLALPAFANTGHQSGWNVGWNDESFQGSASECDGAGLDAGDVLWHFVQTKVPAGASSGTLTATYDQAGEIEVDSYKSSGGVLHWAIITGQDTLLTFSSDVTSSGPLNLSHICAAPTDKPSQAPTDKPSDRPSTETGTQVPTASPTGESGGATGTPRVTPPPTDAIGGATTGSGAGWLLAMIGLAALVVGLIVGGPSRRTRRQTPGR